MKMKKLVLLIPFITSLAFAVCDEKVDSQEVQDVTELTTEVPAHLVGATITVRLADGQTSVVPAEKFKVVPRAQQFIVTKVKTSSQITCNVNPHKARVTVLAGHGTKEGVQSSTKPGVVEVESRHGAVYGVQGQYLLNERLSLGAQIQNNKTFFPFVLGYDF